jgi:hypothetical protein
MLKKINSFRSNKTSKCFSIIEQEEYDVEKYLQEEGNIILTDTDVKHIDCSTVDYLKSLLDDLSPNNVYIQCEDNGMVTFDNPIVKISTSFGDKYVYANELEDVLAHNRQFMTFDDTVQEKTQRLMSIEAYMATQGEAGSFVSAMHCQPDSVRLVSNIIVYNVDDKPARLTTKVGKAKMLDIKNGRQEWSVPHRDGDLPAIIGPRGIKQWWVYGKRHRGGDKPALIMDNGHQEWWVNGQLHRENDQPAIINSSGKWWYSKDKLHREGDQPAVITPESQDWWINGNRHREGDQPAVITPELQEWWINGKRHREGDQPAVIHNGGSKWWYFNGQLHRVGKPAVVLANGTREWWVHGERKQ